MDHDRLSTRLTWVGMGQRCHGQARWIQEKYMRQNALQKIYWVMRPPKKGQFIMVLLYLFAMSMVLSVEVRTYRTHK